jgi:hypothetical protein
VTSENPSLLPLLEHSAGVLAPVAARLHVAVAHPPISPHEWQGPAAQAFEQLEEELRSRLRAAEDAAASALHSMRIAIGQLDG